MSEKDGAPGAPTFVVSWSFRASGPVEPQDVVGVLYGETEGLFDGGKSLDDLVENGDVETPPYVNFEHEREETKGEIYVRTHMEKKRTAKLAAVFETVDELGPGYDVEIETEEIKYAEDGREELVERKAVEILQDDSLWTSVPP